MPFGQLFEVAFKKAIIELVESIRYTHLYVLDLARIMLIASGGRAVKDFGDEGRGGESVERDV